MLARDLEDQHDEIDPSGAQVTTSDRSCEVRSPSAARDLQIEAVAAHLPVLDLALTMEIRSVPR